MNIVYEHATLFCWFSMVRGRKLVWQFTFYNNIVDIYARGWGDLFIIDYGELVDVRFTDYFARSLLWDSAGEL